MVLKFWLKMLEGRSSEVREVFLSVRFLLVFGVEPQTLNAKPYHGWFQDFGLREVRLVANRY